MALLAELVNKKEIYTYEINHSQQYTYRGRFLLNTEIDDFYIDRTNKLYTIIERNIYALRDQYVILAEDVYDYKVIDTEYGCLFFWIETANELSKDGKKQYRLVCREANDKILDKKELFILDYSDYKILVISRKNYLVYKDKCIIVQYKGKFYTKEFGFKIIKSCVLSEKIVFLDSDYNIQIYCLVDKNLVTGFKSLGKTIDICTSRFVSLISVATVNGIFSIDVDHKSILKSKLKEEIGFEYERIEFVNKRTLMLIGNNVHEYNLMNGFISIVCETNRNSLFKYITESNGYLIYDNFKDAKECKCNSAQSICDIKIEMRRGLFDLNKKLEYIEKIIEKLEYKKENEK